MLKIVNTNGTVLAYLNNSLQGKIKEGLNGEYVLTFLATIDPLKTDFLYDEKNLIEYNDDLFKISSIQEVHDEENMLTVAVDCEHISYKLIDFEMNDFIKENVTALQAMTSVLVGTGFTLRNYDLSDTKNDIAVDQECNAKQITMNIAQIWDGELSYYKTYIDLKKQRGTNRGTGFIFGKNLKSVSRTIDRIDKKVTYEISVTESPTLSELGYYELGDTVRVMDHRLNIDLEMRIVALEKDILTGINNSVTLGDKVKTLVDGFNNISSKVDKVDKYVQSGAKDWNYIKEMTDGIGNIVIGKLNSITEVANKIVNSTGTFEHRDGALYWQDQPTMENSTFASLWSAQGILFANSKTTDGEWEWQTALDADGIIANKVTARALYGMTMEAVTIMASEIIGGEITGVTMNTSELLVDNIAGITCDRNKPTGDNVIVWAGGPKYDRENAPFQVFDGGKVKMEEAEVAGTIRASQLFLGDNEVNALNNANQIKMEFLDVGHLRADMATVDTGWNKNIFVEELRTNFDQWLWRSGDTSTEENINYTLITKEEHRMINKIVNPREYSYLNINGKIVYYLYITGPESEDWFTFSNMNQRAIEWAPLTSYQKHTIVTNGSEYKYIIVDDMPITIDTWSKLDSTLSLLVTDDNFKVKVKKTISEYDKYSHKFETISTSDGGVTETPVELYGAGTDTTGQTDRGKGFAYKDTRGLVFGTYNENNSDMTALLADGVDCSLKYWDMIRQEWIPLVNNWAGVAGNVVFHPDKTALTEDDFVHGNALHVTYNSNGTTIAGPSSTIYTDGLAILGAEISEVLPPIDPIRGPICLYKDGWENEALTGGWVARKFSVTPPTFTKKTSSLKIEYTFSGPYGGGCGTSNLIEFNEQTTLKIRCTGTAGNLTIATNQNGINGRVLQVMFDKNGTVIIWTPTTGDIISTASFKPEETNDITVTLPISLTGKYYCNMYVNADHGPVLFEVSEITFS